MKKIRMKRILTFLAALFFIFLSPAFSETLDPANMAEQEILAEQKILIEAMKKVVIVRIKLPRKTDGREHNITGAGAFIKENGYILTAYHIIEMIREDEGEIEVCYFPPNGEIENLDFNENYGKVECAIAQLIGYDSENDLALLKIDFNNSDYFKFGRNAAIGQAIFTIGHPFGISWSLDKGVISKALAVIKTTTKKIPQHFIISDALMVPGNSGGPLINAKGELLGLNVRFSPSGMSLAISSEDIAIIIPQLLEKGPISKSFIGIDIYSNKKILGLLITKVCPDSPAQDANLWPGDVILEIDGKPQRNFIDIERAITFQKPGTIVEIKILRQKEELTLKIKLALKIKDFY
ncbi:MAG: serine protease [Candidatus Niyogibacteria bacterium]|nr:serine protease [Candidatus Niyogibacteria bacterium]